MPWALLVAILAWIVVLLTTRYVSVASIAAAVVIPITLVIQSLLRAAWNPVVLGFALFTSTLAIWKHRSNIARLRRGEENRFGKKPPSPAPACSPPDRP